MMFSNHNVDPNVMNQVKSSRIFKIFVKICIVIWVLQFFVFGLIITVMSAFTEMHAAEIRKSGGVDSVAVICELVPGSGSDISEAYAQHVVGTETYTVRLDFVSSEYEIGQTVEIVYERDDPENVACIHGLGSTMRLIGILMMVISTLVIVFVLFRKIIAFAILKHTMKQ